ncbi:MAG TPA: 1-acyl-sn-glycerol-3-phosphate acyltransferase, partial [Acidimicrobiia bacterium]|nr:1-acyl-sn-glycerol-3-phosphate acyltransferase [Acidimicrobiia bacterium]
MILVYQLVRVIVTGVCKVAFRVRVRGKNKIPRSGAFILAPSHRSLLDIPFGSFVTRRRTYFLAKKELFERAWLA